MSSQEFFVSGKLPGLNEIVASAKVLNRRGGKNFFSGYAKLKRQAETPVILAIRAAGLTPMPRVWIEYTWVEPDRRRDPSNIAAARKFIEDPLVTEGILKNDGHKEIAGWTDRFDVNKETPGVRVTMREVS